MPGTSEEIRCCRAGGLTLRQQGNPSHCAIEARRSCTDAFRILAAHSLFLVLAAVSVCLPHRVAAQDVTVFYVHGPKGESSPQLYYRLAGEDTLRRASGVPKPLRVPEGGRACFRVESANPLLYTYAIGSQVLKVDAPDTVSSVFRGILALIPKAIAPGFLPEAVTRQTYADRVAEVFRLSTLLTELKEGSDGASSMRVILDSSATLLSQARAASASADKLYKELPKADQDDATVRLVRAHQMALDRNLQVLVKTFNSARESIGRLYCQSVTNQPLRLSLGVSPNGSDVPAERLIRTTGAAIASVDIQPVANRDVDFGLGLVLNIPLRRYSTYSVSDGVLQETKGEQILFRPIAMVHLRGWASENLWATLGTGGSAASLSDAYFGITYRAGNLGGFGASLSAGLAIARLQTDLKKGAVGQSLPTGVSFDQAVSKAWTPGIGLAVSVSAP